jgi:hypothetical protein
MNMNASSETAQPHDANCLREIARLYLVDRGGVARENLSDYSDEILRGLVKSRFVSELAGDYYLTPRGLGQAAQDALGLAGELMCFATASYYDAGYEDAGGDDDHDDHDGAPEAAKEDSRSIAPTLNPYALTPQNAPRDAAKLAQYTPFQLSCLAWRHLGGMRTEAERAAWYGLNTTEARVSYTLELLGRWDAKQ